MKLLRSTWGIAILALLCGLGTQSAVIVWRLGPLIHVDEKAEPPAPTLVPEAIAWSFDSPAIERLSGELRSRIEEVAAREKELDDYEKRLVSERAELEKVKSDIEGMQKALDERRDTYMAAVTDIQALEVKNLKTLAATYSNVSPSAALAIFREMDDEAVVKILKYMKPDPVGQILEEMARTKDGEGSLAGRAADISNKLRLVRQVTAEQTS